MVFFLARDLEMVVRKLLTKFEKCSILSTAGINGLLKLNMEGVNDQVSFGKVDVGRACEQIMKDSEASPKDIFLFKMERKQFLIAVGNKLKAPPEVAGPKPVLPGSTVHVQQTDECLAGLRKVVDALITAGTVNDHQRDGALAESTQLFQEQGHQL